MSDNQAVADLVQAVETVQDAASSPSPAPSIETVIEAETESRVAIIAAQADADAERIAAEARADVKRIEARQGDPELMERLAKCEDQISEMQQAQLAQLSLLETINTRLAAPQVILATGSPSSTPTPSQVESPPSAEPPVENPESVAGAQEAPKTNEPPPKEKAKRFVRF